MSSFLTGVIFLEAMLTLYLHTPNTIKAEAIARTPRGTAMAIAIVDALLELVLEAFEPACSATGGSNPGGRKFSVEGGGAVHSVPDRIDSGLQ